MERMIEEDVVIKAKTPQLITDLLHEINPLPVASKVLFKHPKYHALRYKQLPVVYNEEQEQFLTHERKRFSIDEAFAQDWPEIRIETNSQEGFFVFRIGLLDELAQKYRPTLGKLDFPHPVAPVTFQFFPNDVAEVTWSPNGWTKNGVISPEVAELLGNLQQFEQKKYVFNFQHNYRMEWKHGSARSS